MVLWKWLLRILPGWLYGGDLGDVEYAEQCAGGAAGLERRPLY
ncbi:hypothetical protein [Bacillus sp. T3]|nr:hypothetical protein [Bacillus sp. T3]